MPDPNINWNDIIYPELRRIATRMLRRYPGETSSATTLVNEAVVKLLTGRVLDGRDQDHLTALGVRAMRQVLVDSARRKQAQKRGEGSKPVELSESLCDTSQDSPEAVVRVEQALEQLEKKDQRAAQVFEFSYFGGMTQEDIAERLEISAAMVRVILRRAKVQLKETLWTTV